VSTGAVVGLVALLVLGGGAVVYAATRKPDMPAGPAPGAVPPGDLSTADYLSSLPYVGPHLAREYGRRMAEQGGRSFADQEKDRAPAAPTPPPEDKPWAVTRQITRAAATAAARARALVPGGAIGRSGGVLV
jgi:hypothetical protein